MSATKQPLASLSAADVASYFLRTQGSENFYTANFAAGQSIVVPRNVTLDRPLAGLLLNWHGRVQIATAAYTAVAAEAPQSIIEEIIVKGNHSRFSQVIPWDIRGAMAFVYPQLFSREGTSLYINGTRQADPSAPFAQAGATFGNVSTYDLDIFYWLPVWPFGMPDGVKAGYLWTSADFKDSLQISIKCGDQTSFGTPGGTTVVTFSSFGSGAGSPVININAVYSVLGPLEGSILPALMVRNFQAIPGATVQNAGSNQVILELQKYRTRSVLLKTGVILTGTSAGVNVYASLNDHVVDPAILAVDSKKLIRNPNSTLESKEYYAQRHKTILPQGYNLLDFVDEATAANPLTMFPADQKVPAGSHFQIKGNIPTSIANAAAEALQEYQVGAPTGVGA
jgi:hypothetical protein